MAPAVPDLSVTNLFNLKNWVCLVTGGGTGLGLMTAHALAQNGAKVYVTGRRLSKLQDAETSLPESALAAGGKIIALQMDVTDKTSIRATVAELARRGEKYLNLLVNNAGVTGLNYGASGTPQGTAQEISDAMFDNQSIQGWTDMYAINVASYYFTSAAFLPLLTAAAGAEHSFGGEAGSILNISSISGITKESQNGQFAYNASKAACISLTEQLAVDLKRPGLEVRVNTLAPGYFPSEMTPISDTEGDKAHFRTARWEIPFGRPGNARDYAQAVLNFAVNGYVTGSTLVIDGGWLLAHA